MTMFRMPIFVWNAMVTSLLDPRGLPDPDRRASSAMLADRNLGALIYSR